MQHKYESKLPNNKHGSTDYVKDVADDNSVAHQVLSYLQTSGEFDRLRTQIFCESTLKREFADIQSKILAQLGNGALLDIDEIERPTKLPIVFSAFRHAVKMTSVRHDLESAVLNAVNRVQDELKESILAAMTRVLTSTVSPKLLQPTSTDSSVDSPSTSQLSSMDHIVYTPSTLSSPLQLPQADFPLSTDNMTIASVTNTTLSAHHAHESEGGVCMTSNYKGLKMKSNLNEDATSHQSEMKSPMKRTRFEKTSIDIANDQQNCVEETVKTSIKMVERVKTRQRTKGYDIKLECDKKKKVSQGLGLVGMFVKVFWPEDKMWYAGFISKFSSRTGKHLVHYNDDTKEKLLLDKERWRIVDENDTEDEEEFQEENSSMHVQNEKKQKDNIDDNAESN